MLIFIAEENFAQQNTDKEKIRNVIEKYRTGWLKLDINILKNIWDQEYKNIIYIAMELKESIHGWEGVKNYYEGTAKDLLEVKKFDLINLSIDAFQDTAYAFCSYHFLAITKKDNQSIGGDGRITFILKKKGNKWLVIHYHESAPHGTP
jgi:ketosteroid isomerase-like protein